MYQMLYKLGNFLLLLCKCICFDADVTVQSKTKVSNIFVPPGSNI